tara:strand:- start:100 stop:528 length:429 start_codon:yes stop_codon:yes gene_type:complete
MVVKSLTSAAKNLPSAAKNGDVPEDGAPISITLPSETGPNPQKSSSTFALFVNCIPRKTKVTYLEDWAQPFVDAVCEKFRVRHLGVIKYGGGKHALAEAVLEYLADGGAVPNVLVIDRRLPMSDTLLEVLLPRASSVVERMQ